MVGQPLSALYDGYQYMSTMDFKHTGIPVLFYGKKRKYLFYKDFKHTGPAGLMEFESAGQLKII